MFSPVALHHYFAPQKVEEVIQLQCIYITSPSSTKFNTLKLTTPTSDYSFVYFSELLLYYHSSQTYSLALVKNVRISHASVKGRWWVVHDFQTIISTLFHYIFLLIWSTSNLGAYGSVYAWLDMFFFPLLGQFWNPMGFFLMIWSPQKIRDASC